MYIDRLIVKGYKILKDINIKMDSKMNIFVGENDSGKSSILETIQIATKGRIGRIPIDNLISPNLFTTDLRNQYIESDKRKGLEVLPEIIIEVYFNDDIEYANLRGTNNSQSINCPGIRIKIEFDNTYADSYKAMLDANQIRDIPVEYYRVSKHYFNGDTINYRTPMFRVDIYDTQQHDYSNAVNQYVASTLDTILSNDEKVVIKSVYNQALNNFQTDEKVQKVIGKIPLDIIKNSNIGTAEIKARNDVLQSIGDKLEVVLKQVPLSYAGTGTQNIVNAALYLSSSYNSHALMVEEPENSLSFSNMHKLVQIISNSTRQIFITTHSSYITNHIGLNYVHFIANNMSTRLNQFNNDDIAFFQKLSGYDTLRFILASKVILVEGPSDELIITRAYLDLTNRQLRDDGIDVISVGGLIFNRYCALAKKIRKKVVIVTDNDGNIEGLKTRYSNILDEPTLFHLCYEKDETLNTLETSIVHVNENPEDYSNFVSIVSATNTQYDRNSLINFMKNNKTQWAMKIAASDKKVHYPDYINEAALWWETNGK